MYTYTDKKTKLKTILSQTLNVYSDLGGVITRAKIL